jgi:hypothetical protein
MVPGEGRQRAAEGGLECCWLGRGGSTGEEEKQQSADDGMSWRIHDALRQALAADGDDLHKLPAEARLGKRLGAPRVGVEPGG